MPPHEARWGPMRLAKGEKSPARKVINGIQNQDHRANRSSGSKKPACRLVAYAAALYARDAATQSA